MTDCKILQFSRIPVLKDEKNLFPPISPSQKLSCFEEYKGDPVLEKLQVIDNNLKESKETIGARFNRLSKTQQHAIHGHIAKDLEKTKSHLYSMSYVLLSYLASLKGKMSQNPLIHNTALPHVDHLYDVAHKASLFLPKSLALLDHSLQRFPKYARKLQESLKKISAILKEHKGRANFLKYNKNYEWLKMRAASLKQHLSQKKYEVSKKIDQKSYQGIMKKILEVNHLSKNAQSIEYSLLKTAHQNGMRFYEALLIQNTLNQLRYFCKHFEEA